MRIILWLLLQTPRFKKLDYLNKDESEKYTIDVTVKSHMGFDEVDDVPNLSLPISQVLQFWLWHIRKSKSSLPKYDG